MRLRNVSTIAVALLSAAYDHGTGNIAFDKARFQTGTIMSAPKEPLLRLPPSAIR